jgi:ribonuclease III
VIAAERVASLGVLQERLGYAFRDLSLLESSLTHKSYAYEMAEGRGHYERLEFLGDAVLDLIVSTYLYTLLPAASEGQLSTVRARIVSEKSLAILACHLELGAFLLLGRGEELTGGRTKHSLLAAALEAVIAAVYLDGGFAVAHDVFLRCFMPRLAQWARAAPERDYKGLLQERTLQIFGCLPTYRVVREDGPAHQKTFHVQLTLNHEYVCVGVGRSRKAAEQHAAQQLLEQLQQRCS